MLYLLEGLQRVGVASLLLAPPASPLLQRAQALTVAAAALRVRGDGDLWAAVRLRRWLRQRPVDLVHCHTAHAHAIYLLASKFLPGSSRLVVSQRVAFARRGRLRRWKLLQADCLVAVSEAVRAELLSLGVPADRIVVIRDGIEAQRFAAVGTPSWRQEVRQRLGVPLQAPMVLTVGYLSAEKGVEDLLPLAAAVRQSCPLVWFVVAGEGPLRSRLEREVRRRDLPIRLAGFWPPEELPALMAAADVFVFPSRQEGLGSALLEAMASGLPVVATRVGGIPELVEDGHTGLLVPPGDPPALAQAVEKVLQDRELRQQLGAAARQRVCQTGTAERMVAETLALYRRLLHQSPS